MRLSGKFTIIFSQNVLCANLLTCLVIGQKEQQTLASRQYVANYTLHYHLVQIPYPHDFLSYFFMIYLYEILWNNMKYHIYTPFYAILQKCLIYGMHFDKHGSQPLQYHGVWMFRMDYWSNAIHYHRRNRNISFSVRH